MGDPMDRFFRPNPQRGRLVWTAIAVGVVTIVALLMLLTNVADTAEALATLLVAPVFAVALYRGRTGGLVTAACAAAAYAWARLADGDGAGAAGVALLVLSRAGLYALTACAAPWVVNRLPVLSLADLGRRSRRLDDAADLPDFAPTMPDFAPAMPDLVPAMSGAAPDGPHLPGPPDRPRDDAFLRARELDLHGWAEAAGGDTGREEAGPHDAEDEAEDLRVGPVWEEPLDPGVMTPPTGVPHVAAEQELEEVPWDHPTAPETVTGNGGDHGPPEWEDPSPPAGLSFPAGPAAPAMPTGWIDDATSPLGDENIPVGFTGELFLPHDLQDAPGPRAAEPAPQFAPAVVEPPESFHQPEPYHEAQGYPEPEQYQEPDPFQGPQGYEPEHEPFQGRQGYEHEPFQGHESFRDHESYESDPFQGPPGYEEPGPFPGPEPSFPARQAVPRPEPAAAPVAGPSDGIDPETRLWNARFFRDRLNAERELAVQQGGCFSVVMLQVPDAPFQPLPYRRQVALLRELGHQFVQARVVDHLVHLPDGAQHWFAVVLGGSDRGEAHLVERRLRSAVGGYLRSRGLQVVEIQSASLTSPDDDEAMAGIWASLLGSRV